MASLLVAGTIAAVAPQADAAVTVGQIGNPGASSCVAGFDWPQVATAAGNSYVVPSTGGVTSWRVTSWRSFGGASDIQMKLKFFRATGAMDTYQVVGQSSPQTVQAGGLAGNTFPADITVQAGDLLGLHTVTDGQCAFGTVDGGDLYGEYFGDLGDGQSASFMVFANYRMDIDAELTPLNTFSVGKTQLNRKKGTALLSVELPNPGTLAASGKGAKVASTGAHSSKSVAAGSATLLVKAKGKKAKQLRQTGKAKLRLSVSYTPTGGEANTSTVKLKLRKL